MLANKNKTLVLSIFNIQEILRHFGIDWIRGTLVERLKIAISNYNPQKLSIPVRSRFQYEKSEPGLIEWIPVYDQHDQGGKDMIKLVGGHPSSPDKFHLPTIVSKTSEYDTNYVKQSCLQQELETRHRQWDTRNLYDSLKNLKPGNTNSRIKKAVSILSAQG